MLSKENGRVFAEVHNFVGVKFTIPEGFRPTTTVYIPAMYTDTSYAWHFFMLEVHSDGKTKVMQAGTERTDGWVFFNASWLTD